MLKKYEDFLDSIRDTDEFRKLYKIDSSYIDFSSNDYLNLSNNKDIINAGYLVSKKYGAGSTGSRLLSGNKDIYDEFERLISCDKNMENTLIFGSGYQANFGMIDCLADKKTLVLFDKLNHASLYRGVFSSGARLIRYNHIDYDELENILEENKDYDNKIIVSETVFGMDGDIADIEKLSYLSDKYDTILYLDEAHATGLYGPYGYGISTSFKNLSSRRTIVMGTFSKAIGCFGAYVSSSNLIYNFIINKCNSFIYSTSLSPFCVGASYCAWKMIRGMGSERDNLLQRSDILRRKIKDMGYNVIGNKTNIIPIIMENTKSMMNLKNRFMEKKIIVSGIRRPTSKTPRIRIALNLSHTDENIAQILDILKEG